MSSFLNRIKNFFSKNEITKSRGDKNFKNSKTSGIFENNITNKSRWQVFARNELVFRNIVRQSTNALCRGYDIVSKNEERDEETERWLIQKNFNKSLWVGLVHSYVFGSGYLFLKYGDALTKGLEDEPAKNNTLEGFQHFHRENFNEDKETETHVFFIPKHGGETKIHKDRILRITPFPFGNDGEALPLIDPNFDISQIKKNMDWSVGEIIYRRAVPFADISVPPDDEWFSYAEQQFQNGIKGTKALVHQKEDEWGIDFKGGDNQVMNVDPFSNYVQSNLGAGFGLGKQKMMGSDAGAIASAKTNNQDFYKEVHAIQTLVLTDVIRAFLERMEKYGCIQELPPKYKIEWRSQWVFSERDKAVMLLKKSMAMERLHNMGFEFEPIGSENFIIKLGEKKIKVTKEGQEVKEGGIEEPPEENVSKNQIINPLPLLHANKSFSINQIDNFLEKKENDILAILHKHFKRWEKKVKEGDTSLRGATLKKEIVEQYRKVYKEIVNKYEGVLEGDLSADAENPFEELIEGMMDKKRKEVEEEAEKAIKEATIAGKTGAEKAALLNNLFQDYTGYQLKTISNTLTSRFFNHARYDITQKATNTTGYRMNSVLDERTTPQCRELHGVYFNKNDPTLWKVFPPGHFNCRRIATPVLKRDEVEEYSNAENYSHLVPENFWGV